MMKMIPYLMVILFFSSFDAMASQCPGPEDQYLIEAQGSAMSFEDTGRALFCLVSQKVPSIISSHANPFETREALEESRSLTSTHREFVIDRTDYLLAQPSFPKNLRLSYLQLRLLLGEASSWPEALELSRSFSFDQPEDLIKLATVAGLGKIEAALEWIISTDLQIKEKHKAKPQLALSTRQSLINAIASMDTAKSWEVLEKLSHHPDETPEVKQHAARLLQTLKSSQLKSSQPKSSPIKTPQM